MKEGMKGKRPGEGKKPGEGNNGKEGNQEKRVLIVSLEMKGKKDKMVKVMLKLLWRFTKNKNNFGMHYKIN